MKFDKLESKRLLPEWMRGDSYDLGLSKAMDKTLIELYEELPMLNRWNRIDEMTEAQVDALAWELNIPWYMSNADLETKRMLVKESDLVHSKLGTEYAVNLIIQRYFGTGTVKAWYDYDGKPYHFRVETDQVQKVADNYVLFLDILSKVKRASAVLDATVIKLESENPIYAGFAYHELVTERVVFNEIEEGTNGD